LKKIAIITVAVLLGLFGFKACRKVQQKQDKQATSTTLQPGQKEKIVVDPTKHTITITTPDGTKSTYLPDRPTQIIENKDGSITVIDHKYGAELKPYLGAGGSLDGTPRLHIGADGFYFKRLDLGGGFDFNPTSIRDTRLSVNASYNFYSNTSLALSIDNRKFVGLFIKVRL
jgi:hypothetical protein